MNHIKDLLHAPKTPHKAREQAKSGWDEGVSRFMEFDLKMLDKKRKLVPATKAHIGKKLGMAGLKEGDLFELYQYCKRSRNPGMRFNWYLRERIPR